MLVVGGQQVQLAVLLHGNTQVVQSLDGGVTCQEIVRTGTKRDDLQVLEAQDGGSNGSEVVDALHQLFRGAHGNLGDIDALLTQAQVVAGVQHAAVGVATAIEQVAVTLGSAHIHQGTVKEVGNHGLGGLGAEVAQEDHQGVDAMGHHVVDGVAGLDLGLHGDGALIQALAVGGLDGGAAALRQGDGEAVAGHGNDAQLQLRNVCNHGNRLLLLCKKFK